VIHVNPDWRKVLTVPEELVEWVASRPEATFYDIWDETINPAWLPHLAEAGGATKQQIVFAACAVARLCLHLVPEGENRPRVAIETIEAWCRDEATAGQVREAINAANAANAAYANAAYAAYAANAAYAAAYAASAVYAATNSAASYSATNANAASVYAVRAGIESQLICATLRKNLPFERPPRPKGLTIWQRLAKVGGDE